MAAEGGAELFGEIKPASFDNYVNIIALSPEETIPDIASDDEGSNPE